MNHYHQPDLLESILSGLKNAGLNLSSLTRQDLSGLDEFHLQGASVSLRLAQKLNLSPENEVLDVGCGIGGPCRMLADEFGCLTTGLDYTAEYIRTAKALSEMVGLGALTTFVEGNALDLPFATESFDVVWTQHAQMNIADKTQFYSEIQRVLKKGGQFLYYDVFQGKKSGLQLPVPWAEVAEDSHLMFHNDLVQHFDKNNWKRTFSASHTQNAITALERVKAGPLPNLGVNLLMRESTKLKLKNLLQALQQDQVEVHAGMYAKLT